VLRIVGGKFRSRRIHTLVDNLSTRPTADRIRENIFNILQSKIENASVLDLFSGTGAMGIEALSRGAKSCVFVESNPTAAKLIHSNLELLQIPSSQYKVFCKEVSHFLAASASTPIASSNSIFEPYEIVFADPPYNSTWYSNAIEEVFTSNQCSKNCTVCIEMNMYTDLEAQENETWKRIAQKKYGKTRLELWTQQETN
jgi:16S rRNA (guanine(966)-N(2))-methyltransferase RsmD